MEEQFVTYEIALKLKELGFNKDCFGFYDGEVLWIKSTSKDKINESNILAPLWQQAFDWFRTEHKIMGVVAEDSVTIETNKSYYYAYIQSLVNGPHKYQEFLGFTSYEEARIKCLEELIDTISFYINKPYLNK